MRRGIGILAIVLVILAGVGIGVGAYHAGVDEGIRRTADASQVVEVVGGYRGGYFPFGFFLFPLLLIGGFALARAAFFGRRGGHHHGGPGNHGPWSGGGAPWDPDEGRARFEEKAAEWHRSQHGDVSSPAGGSPPTA